MSHTDLTENELQTLVACLRSYVPQLTEALRAQQRSVRDKKLLADLKRRVADLEQVRLKSEAALERLRANEVIDLSSLPDPVGQDRAHQLALDTIKHIGLHRFTIYSVLSTRVPESLQGFEILKKISTYLYKRGFQKGAEK